MEDQQEELRQQIREMKKLQKELTIKTNTLESEMADRLKEELQRMSELQADLLERENQLKENDKLQEELEMAMEHRQKYIFYFIMIINGCSY